MIIHAVTITKCVHGLWFGFVGMGSQNVYDMWRTAEKTFIFKMGNEHSVAYLVYKI